MSIAKLSVKNPVLINILTILVLVLGFFSFQRLPQEQFAEVPFYFVNVIVPYPGVAAEDVERTVTIPIEDEMANLDRVDTVRSETTEGLSSVTIEFDQGVSRREFERLFQQVQNRFNRVSLPSGVQQETIEEFSSNDFVPVIEVVLTSELDYAELVQTAEDLRDRLRGIRGVSQLELIGVRDREVVVGLERERLEAYDVGLREVVAALRSTNLTVPGGTVQAGDREYLLRTVGEVRDPRELERTIVRGAEDAGGQALLLSNLATVEDRYLDEGTQARFNGTQAVSLRVTKLPRASSIDIIESIRGAVTRYEPTLPDGIEIAYFNDQSIPIRNSLDVLFSNAILGLVLVVLILFVFLGLRNAFMTALGIPLTFAITFMVLEASGETLNSNTLFALVLVLGLIVDHAIVTVENSYRLQQQGLERREAALQGAQQVIVPVIAATATTIAAFLPLAFLPGVIGRFLRVVPITVSIALAASVLEASLFLPSHFADWPGKGRSASRGVFVRLEDLFERILRALYRRKWRTLAVMFALMIGVFGMAGRVPPDLFAAEDFSLFYIEIEMPPGTALDRTSEVVERYEQHILPRIGDGEVNAVNSAIGFAGGGDAGSRRSNIAQLSVDLTEVDEGRERPIAAIMEEIERETSGIAGPEVVEFRTQPSGPPTDPPVSFQLFGEDLEELRDVAEAFRVRLAEFPELYNISDNLDRGTPEIRVLVDPASAARYGLSVESVGDFVRGAFDGVVAGSVFTRNEELDVRVRYAWPEDVTVEQILQLRIPADGAERRLVPFSSVATSELAEGIAAIRRIDGRREVTVEAEAFSTENLGEINRTINELWDSELADEYPAVELSVGGQFAELLNVFGDILRVFLVGVFLIYAILGTQFRSYTQPLLILFSVPFAFVGVIAFLLVSGTALSSTVIYAGVALAGIAVNDSIVLLSFINERRAAGLEVIEAVIGAARTRLRAIVLTSLTTIAGLAPTALGLFGESIVWGPMASTIVFGLLFSTLTALLVMPCLYGAFYGRSSAASAGKRITRT